MKLKIQLSQELRVPKGTKIIRNDDWLTLARVTREKLIGLVTIPTHEVGSADFLDESMWSLFTKEEIKKIAKTFIRQ